MYDQRSMQSLAAGAGALSALGRPGDGPTAIDLSQAVFRPGNTVRVAELLQALTWVKGTLVQVDVGNLGTTASVLKVTVRNAAALTNPTLVYTDLTQSLSSGPTSQLNPVDNGTLTELPLVRLGLQVAAPKIDMAVAPAVSKNAAAWRVEGSATELLAGLDTGVGRNLVDVNNTTVFRGLTSLITPEDGSGLAWDVAAINLLSNVVTSSRGAGEGAHCLIGNDGALRSLARSATGLVNGSCGWKVDARTGLFLYHFLGVPFYRTNLYTSPDPVETSLFAANLGSSGLQMVHAYGSAATWGVQVDEDPTRSTSASSGYVVHGAWALALWEPQALRGYDGITVTG